MIFTMKSIEVSDIFLKFVLGGMLILLSDLILNFGILLGLGGSSGFRGSFTLVDSCMLVRSL